MNKKSNLDELKKLENRAKFYTKRVQSKKDKLSHSIKQMQYDIQKLQLALNTHKASHEASIFEDEKALNLVKKQIKSIQQQGTCITVSDHCMIRYMERVMGVDIEYIKSQVLSSSVIEAIIAVNGNGEISLSDGEKLIVRDFKAITIVK